MSGLLQGKRVLVVGLANKDSIAYGIAQAVKAEGAELAVTYLNEKALRFVQPCLDDLQPALAMPMDVTKDGEMEAVFAALRERWGGLDGIVHSIAAAREIKRRVIDTTMAGFAEAMDISVHSFARLAHHAEPLMGAGSALVTVTYAGSGQVIENYNIMGPCKAALESLTRYMAMELGPKGITVNAVSPGPIHTRAASGIGGFDALAAHAVKRSPLRRLVQQEEVGRAVVMLLCTSAITGTILPVDAGESVVGYAA